MSGEGIEFKGMWKEAAKYKFGLLAPKLSKRLRKAQK
jgi:hypothetical protein